MQFLSNLRTRLRKNLLKNNAGQGATEYILLLVVIVGLIMAFGPRIKKAVSDKVGNLEESMANVKSE